MKFTRTVNRPAFLVNSPEIANHYAPIWNELRDLPFDILITPQSGLPNGLSLDGLPVRVRNTETVIALGLKYRLLVSNHYVGYHNGKVRIPNTNVKLTLSKPDNIIKKLATKNIRCMYAAGKFGWNLSDWNKLYDGIMCFGPKHASLFTEKFSIPVVEIGYPRFDSYFTDPINSESLVSSLGGCKTRKTVVWLPTWRDLSSLCHFNDEIAELARTYNVIVKAHPSMVRDDPSRVNKLDNLGLTAVIKDPRDNVPLYQIADVMLFDYGGPAFGGIYTNKPFVLLNVPNAADDGLTGVDSSDIMLREHFLNVNPGTGDLVKLLSTEIDWSSHQEACKLFSTHYFAPYHGTAAAAAASAIKDLSWMDTPMARAS